MMNPLSSCQFSYPIPLWTLQLSLRKNVDFCSFIHMCLCQSVVTFGKPQNSKLSKIQFETKIVIIILETNTAFTMQECT